jgi:hypothetical protein
VIRECFGFVGLIVTVAGLAMVSRPAAVMVAGVSIVVCAIFAPDRKKKTGS